MDVTSQAAPAWNDRLLAALQYAGLTPILGRLRKGRPFVEHHYGQALALYFVLLCIVLLYIAFSLFLSYILVFRRSWYENTWVEPTLLSFVRRAFLCWLVVWVFATAWALLGWWRSIPLIGRLSGVRWTRRVSLAGTAALLVLALAVGGLTAHAQSLIRHDDEAADAYLLYDDMGLVPHWMFDLGFYPITLAATEQWGKDTVVTQPLTRERLSNALKEGRFVFVLSHGTEDGLYTSNFKIRPANAASHGTGENLQFVYITGCDSGTLAAEWERALAPAEVITFPRLSAWVEHIYWLLLRGADKVRELR